MTIKGFLKTNPARFIWLMVNNILVYVLIIALTQLTLMEMTALQNNDWKTTYQIFAIETVIMLLDYFLQSFNFYLVSKQEEEYSVNLRAQITDHFYEDGRDHSVAQVQNRLTNDLVQNKENYLEAFLSFVGACAMLISVLILLITIHWSLLLAIIIMTIISLIIPKLIEKPLQKATMQISSSNQQYLDSLEKWLSGLAEIRRYLAGAQLFRVTDKAAKKLEDANIKQNGFMQCLSSINSLIAVFFSFILFVLSGYLFSTGEVGFGVIVAISNCRYYMESAIEQMVQAYGQMKGAQNLNGEIAQTSSQIVKPVPAKVQTPAAFDTHNLSLQFPNGEKLLFPDINVQPGEKILLTGDSGVGKTTLFKLLLGLIKPSSGKIIFKDENGQAINPDMSKVGYIPQDPVLFPVSIADNMTMFEEKLRARLPRLVKEVQLSGDIAKFDQGLNEQINVNNLNISGGQRQKIVLVRALAHQSKIILIDEGTSAIDQQATMEILREVTNTSATVLFIAHNFNEQMKQLFDREIQLKKLN